MNVLERLVADELTRVPAGPAADDLRRRARIRRARRVGAVATVAIVFAVLAIAAMLQSPDSHRVQVSEPAPTESSTESSTAATVPPPSALPLATTVQFPPLAKMVETVSGVVKSNADPKAVVANPTSAEIVATTDTRAFAFWGGTHHDKPIYVVQVVGKFLCETCYGPGGSTAPRGDALQVFFDASGHGNGFGFSPHPRDIAQLGKVYRLPLP
jgi:hypothetical protein